MFLKENTFVEVPVFLIFFVIALSGPVNINFVIYRTCHVILERNETLCAQLGTETADDKVKELEAVVQPVANYVLTVVQVVSELLPAVTCLFICPWSDVNGRKRILSVALLGCTVMSVIKMLVALTPQLSPWYLLVLCVPGALSGGVITFVTLALCYASDVTSVDNRGLRMGIMEGALSFGTIAGASLSWPLYNGSGYVFVFFVCAVATFLAFLSTLTLRETVPYVKAGQKQVKLISWQPLKEMFHTATRNRPSNDRTILLLLIVSMTVYIFTTMEGHVTFLYLRLQLNWSLDKYAFYVSLNSILWIAGTFVSVYVVHKLLKVHEAPLILAGYLMLSLGFFIMGVATNDRLVYLAAIVRCFGGAVNPMMRSWISKVVSADEMGKIFSLAIVVESLTILAAQSAFTVIYNSTMDDFPGTFCLIKSAIFVLDACLLTIIMLMSKGRQRIPYSAVPKSEVY